MAEEHNQRITLEDYSSSSVPQFFTSIARPEVQANNINYPHSLIHLMQGTYFKDYLMKIPIHTWQRSLKYVTLLRLPVYQMRLLGSAFSHSHWQEKPRGGSTHSRATV